MKTFIRGNDNDENRTDERLKDNIGGWLEYLWLNCRAEQEKNTKGTPDTKDIILMRLELKKRQRRQETLTLKERQLYKKETKWQIKERWETETTARRKEKRWQMTK